MYSQRCRKKNEYSTSSPEIKGEKISNIIMNVAFTHKRATPEIRPTKPAARA